MPTFTTRLQHGVTYGAMRAPIMRIIMLPGSLLSRLDSSTDPSAAPEKQQDASEPHSIHLLEATDAVHPATADVDLYYNRAKEIGSKVRTLKRQGNRAGNSRSGKGMR